MSVEGLKNYYANLLILQYKGKPKAVETVRTVAGFMIMDELPVAVKNAFDVETAVGVQLDTIGEIVDVSRNQNSFTSPVTLNDDDYRILIKIKIVQNNSNSDLATIKQLLFDNFGTDLTVTDYTDMTLGYVLDAAIGGNPLAEVFVTGGFLPRPMGVRLRSLIISPTDELFFGYRTYTQDAVATQSPFNTYDAYELDRPWLTYDDGVTL